MEKLQGLNKRREREECMRLQGEISEKKNILQQRDGDERLNTSSASSASSASKLNSSAANSLDASGLADAEAEADDEENEDDDNDNDGPRIRKVDINERILVLKAETRKCESILNEFKNTFIELGCLKKDFELPKR